MIAQPYGELHMTCLCPMALVIWERWVVSNQCVPNESIWQYGYGKIKLEKKFIWYKKLG